MQFETTSWQQAVRVAIRGNKRLSVSIRFNLICDRSDYNGAIRFQSGFNPVSILKASRVECGVDLYLKQIKDVGSIQSVVAQPVQQLHLSARGQFLERSLPKWVGLPLFQFPAVTDDVIEIAAERLWAAR